MSCPDPFRPDDPLAGTDSDAEFNIRHALPSDDEVRTLTGTLAASGGGSSSTDLALDLILNQIVEQACLATGATGSAIALMRDGEMVCRATTGRTAPDLGMRLDNAGFSAECLRIGTLQRCDDTETDPRVDSVACRLLGVRSILVVPLWYWGEFMGIFEIFSPRPNAFGERDEQTLQALAYRIVRQAKQANGVITGFAETTAQLPPPPPPKNPIAPPLEPTPIRIVETEPLLTTTPMPVYELTPAKPATERPDVWTMALAGCAILMACAIVGLMIWRVGWAGDDVKKVSAAPEKAQVVSAPTQPADAVPAPQEEILELSAPGEPPAPRTAKAASTAGNVVVRAAEKADAPLPPSTGLSAPDQGGLAIYDHGKLIYGKPIADPEPPSLTESPKSSAPKPRLSANAIEPSVAPAGASGKGRYVQLSSDAADALVTNRIEPEYPDAARRAHVQGTVTVDTVVGADGQVLEADAISGSPQLMDAATAAVRQWHYKPHVVNGQKVPFRTQVPVTFMLPQ